MLDQLLRSLRDWYLFRQTVHYLEMLDDHLLDDLGTDREHIEHFARESLRPESGGIRLRQRKRTASGLETARDGNQI